MDNWRHWEHDGREGEERSRRPSSLRRSPITEALHRGEHVKLLGSAHVSRIRPDSPGQGVVILQPSPNLSCPVTFGILHSESLSCQNNFFSCLHSIYNSLKNPEGWSSQFFPLLPLWKTWAEHGLQQGVNEAAIKPRSQEEGGGRATCCHLLRGHQGMVSASHKAHPVCVLPQAWANLCSGNPGQMLDLKHTGLVSSWASEVQVSVQVCAAASPLVKIFTPCAP